jgi:hypothetical protein
MQVYGLQKKVKIAFAVFSRERKIFRGKGAKPVRNRLAITKGF